MCVESQVASGSSHVLPKRGSLGLELEEHGDQTGELRGEEDREGLAEFSLGFAVSGRGRRASGLTSNGNVGVFEASVSRFVRYKHEYLPPVDEAWVGQRVEGVVVVQGVAGEEVDEDGDTAV